MLFSNLYFNALIMVIINDVAYDSDWYGVIYIVYIELR